MDVTKKVPTLPDGMLSPRAQKGYQFPDTSLVLNGSMKEKHVKILCDTEGIK